MTTDRAIGSRSARRGERHPLLGAFPLSVLTLATFLVVFAILMARLARGVDPALRASTGASVVREVGPGGRIVTRSSTATSGAGGTAVAGAASNAGETAVLTRSSGSRAEVSDGA